MVKQERAKEIRDMVNKDGIDSTVSHFGLTHETVSRYVRLANEVKFKDSEPRVLVMDIECLPIVATTWNVWNTNIAPVNIINDWTMLSFSYKWLGEKDVHNFILTPAQAKARDDRDMVISIHKLFNEADIIIGYNSIKFDEKKMNSKFLEFRLPKPTPYQSIDLYRTVKQNFANTYNKMDWTNKILGLDRKLEHSGMQLWMDCHNGVKKALDVMAEYNDVDVLITEQLYFAIRGWIKNHPNMALFQETDDNVCHKCGSHDIVPSKEKHRTAASVFDLYECKSCGGYSRAKSRSHTTELRPY
ncbi:MAG: hypothetical protein GY777_25555 [Candidatus Brocadiaceae bacterium]|nr:hypothetical protein [Candidatus Brocadiaceae bacterium]